MNPVDALGAVARARQIVVVGDDKQLPPTSFFDKVLADGDGEAADDTFSASDVESILGLCTAQGMPQRMLRGTTAAIMIPRLPSRTANSMAIGCSSFRAPFAPRRDRGSSFGMSRRAFLTGAVRRLTALKPASLPRRPWITLGRTRIRLGIGAFSVAQRDAIRDELEILRREDTSCESFFAPGNRDPFFIKNLENIQGDERDVIFISVGYGRDADGNLVLNFGPLSGEGGSGG